MRTQKYETLYLKFFYYFTNWLEGVPPFFLVELTFSFFYNSDPGMSGENEKQPAQAPEQVPPGCRWQPRESLRQVSCARSDGGRVAFFAVGRELSGGLGSGQARKGSVARGYSMKNWWCLPVCLSKSFEPTHFPAPTHNSNSLLVQAFLLLSRLFYIDDSVKLDCRCATAL